MGANYCQVKFSLVPKEELIQKFKDYQSAQCFSEGNDTYSGHLGIKKGLTFPDVRFENVLAAQEYIEENNNKFGPAFAVQALTDIQKSFPLTAKDEDLLKRLKKVSKTYEDFPAFVVKRTKAMKTKLYTCTSCSSKINTRFVSDIYCPVCGKVFLYTATDLSRMKAWAEKKDKLQVEINKRKSEIKAKQAGKYHKVNVWIVGGNCPS